MYRTVCLVSVLGLLLASPAFGQTLYFNDMNTSDWHPLVDNPDANGWDTLDSPEWGKQTGTVWIDGGHFGHHRVLDSGQDEWGSGHLAIGTEPGTGVTLRWDDSSVDYLNEIVQVSAWMSTEEPFQSISGRFFGLGLGNGTDQFVNIGDPGGNRNPDDYLWEWIAHDGDAGGVGQYKGMHRRSSGGGLGWEAASAGRGMWNGHYDTQVPPVLDPEGRNWFQVMAEIDLRTWDSTPEEEVRWYHYDPVSGDAAPVYVARFDLTNVNKPTDGFRWLRFENNGSTIPEYWVDDVWVNVIPEPTTVWLLTSALIGLGLLGLRRYRR